MTKYYLLLLGCIFLGASTVAYAQSLKAYEKAGDNAYAKQDYYNAVFYYEMVLKSKKKTGLYYKYADACRETFAYTKAETAYKEVMKSPDKSKYPLVEFHHATCLKHNAKYEEAIKGFSQFVQEYPAKDAFKLKAQQEIKACVVAQTIVASPIDTVRIDKLGDNINTPFSDFGAHWVKNEFYYSSLRFERAKTPEELKDKNTPKRLVAKVLKSVENQMGEPIESINLENLHTANSTLSTDGKKLYFTHCTGDKSDSIRCNIWIATWDETKATWVNPKPLPNSINAGGGTNTHPHVAFIPESNQTLLFFASDRTGGQGGTDIWAAEVKGDTAFSLAFNLGKTVNSPENEATPFYYAKTQQLFFSSQWHLGLGGYDIFKSKRIGNTVWQNPENIGFPFNSAANDMYFLINADDTTGFISSNRTGSTTLAGESCCNDIYKFALKTKKPTTTDTLITQVPKKDTSSLVNNTPKKDTNSLVNNTPKKDTNSLVNNTPKKDTNSLVNNTPKKDTNSLVNNTPKKDTNSLVNNTPKKDTSRTPTIDLTSQIDELNKMLPLRLYFHNDEPDSNTTSSTTDKPYELAYQDYMILKPLYRDMHAKQFAPETQPLVLKKIDDFFELDVRGEYNRLTECYDKILSLLDKGTKLEIRIKGYTSPRSPEGYNQNLAKRRITCVRKNLFVYKKGAFLPHFQKGNFTVVEEPLGERESPKGISDAIDDPENSIYSVEASRERRAEIIVIQKK